MPVDPFQPMHCLKHVRPCLQPGAMPQIIRGVLAALLLATAWLPAVAGSPPHEGNAGRHGQQAQEQELHAAGKRGKRKTVKKTVSSDQAIAIPAEGEGEFGPADPYPSTITVSGFKQGKITDLNLTLRGLSHEVAADVNVLLVAPDGRDAFVMGDAGGFRELSDATDLTITLDDEAAVSLPLGGEGELTSGTFQPLNPSDIGDEVDLADFPAPAPTLIGDTALVTFDGSNPNGQWRLFLLDDARTATGTLSNGWTLTIKADAKVKAKKNTHKPKRGLER